jgi:DNA-binding beta-propeller fold protein YncE
MKARKGRSMMLTRRLLFFCVATLVGGCNALPVNSSLPGSTRPPNGMTDNRRAGSWMLPAAKSDKLVYVSDGGNGTVYVLSYSTHKLVGTLTGFHGPAGECVDEHGDVFITDFSGRDIVEYAHGGTSPIATLVDSNGPAGCSIDPSTGNLAVNNGGGSVEVYAQASGTPTTYSFSSSVDFHFCTFDKAGNLFVSGQQRYDFLIVELAKGSSKLKSLKLDGISTAGSLQWYGHFLTVAMTANRQSLAKIARVQIAGGVAKAVSVINLQNQLEPEGTQFWIEGGHIIGATASPRIYSLELLDEWPYPGGGRRVGEFRMPGNEYSLPYGVAVSAAN